MKLKESLFVVFVLTGILILAPEVTFAQTPEIFKGSAKGTVGKYAEEMESLTDQQVERVKQAVEMQVPEGSKEIVGESLDKAEDAVKDSLKIGDADGLKASVDNTVPNKIATELMQKADPAQAEMMKKWQEYATPNEHHKVLDTLVGNWDHELKWWTDPGQDPDESTGQSKIEWIMGGRFIQHDVQGVSMGQPFTGMGLTGYDNGKQVYNSIWIDSMSTGIMKGKGYYNSDTHVLTEEGIFTCPFEGQKSYRAVTTFIDDDHFRYEMFTTQLGSNDEYRSMEISYTRKK